MKLLTRGRPATAREQLPATPREIAIEWLRGKIEDGRAGLDPFDPVIFILKATPNERVWAYRTLELVGAVISRSDQPGRGQRLRAILEADARDTLGLDGSQPPLMADEPLASRSIDAVMDATLRALPELRPLLTVVEGERGAS